MTNDKKLELKENGDIVYDGKVIDHNPQLIKNYNQSIATAVAAQRGAGFTNGALAGAGAVLSLLVIVCAAILIASAWMSARAERE